MSKCASLEIRDSLPDFVHGQLEAARAAEVRAHIAGCDECAAEVELLKLVVASAPVAPPMDVDAIARALPLPTRHGFLLHRGRGETSLETRSSSLPRVMTRPPRFWSRPLVRVAASAAVVTAGALSLLVGRDVLRPEAQVGQTNQVARADSPQVVDVPAPVAASPSQSAASHSVERPKELATATAAGLSLTGELTELSDEHLTTLLNDLDRLEALPAEEPEAVEPRVSDADSNSIGGNW
jgi:anti-sigma factor RsiW